MSDEPRDVLDYRLQQIEKSITDVRDLIVETKIQRKDIDDIKEAVKRNSEDIAALKAVPAKKWKDVTDLVLKLIITAAVTFIIAKVGLA